MAKDARQSDDHPIDDASSGTISPDAALTGDANNRACSGPKPKPAIEASDIQGLRYFDKLKPLLARLHGIGTERDNAGNREFHMDEYCILQLLWMFSPILTSLRALQQASELDKVRKKLGVGRASLGSLSESVRIFGPEPLKEIAAELASQLPQPSQGAFDQIGWTLTAVDGSVVETIVRVGPSGPSKVTRLVATYPIVFETSSVRCFRSCEVQRKYLPPFNFQEGQMFTAVASPSRTSKSHAL